MLARAVTDAVVGLDPRRVEVEAHLQGGLPAFTIVGLADRACQEAKQRVRSAIASAEADGPAAASPSTSRRLRSRRRDPGSTPRLICAADSAAEVALAGVEPVPVRHLTQAVEYLRGESEPPPVEPVSNGRAPPGAVPDLAARRAPGVPATGARGSPAAAGGRERSRARAQGRAVFPARLQLIGTINL